MRDFAAPQPQPGAAKLIAKYEAAASSRASSIAPDPLEQYHQASPIFQHHVFADCI